MTASPLRPPSVCACQAAALLLRATLWCTASRPPTIALIASSIARDKIHFHQQTVFYQNLKMSLFISFIQNELIPSEGEWEMSIYYLI
jgi:hypothetical protein